MRTQLQEARWLLKSLEIRNDTLIKVARSIVERQTAFLEHGEEHMRPMILQGHRRGHRHARVHHLARDLRQVHAHAARRVRAALLLFQPGRRGGRLGHFLDRDPRQDQKLVSEEDADTPLSDSRIAEMLSGEGIPVARRTVAKYREAMGIAPSNERAEQDRSQCNDS